jgi:ABC-type transport system substrate-binding protein
MLAAGYSPIYPAHVSPADLRQRCVGTGPYKLKEFVRGQYVDLERNPDYFIPNRPYMDGIRYLIIGERGTRLAALQAGRADAFCPLEMTKAMADTVKKAVPALVVSETGQLESDVARPMLGWRKEYFTQWPHVKNLVAHNSLYNWGRMQDVWLDK